MGSEQKIAQDSHFPVEVDVGFFVSLISEYKKFSSSEDCSSLLYVLISEKNDDSEGFPTIRVSNSTSNNLDVELYVTRNRFPNVLEVRLFARDKETELDFVAYYISAERSLSRLISSLDSNTIILVLILIANGLSKLHQSHISHNDIQMSEIFLNEYNEPLLSGFHIARMSDENADFSVDFVQFMTLVQNCFPFFDQKTILLCNCFEKIASFDEIIHKLNCILIGEFDAIENESLSDIPSENESESEKESENFSIDEDAENQTVKNNLSSVEEPLHWEEPLSETDEKIRTMFDRIPCVSYDEIESLYSDISAKKTSLSRTAIFHLIRLFEAPLILTEIEKSLMMQMKQKVEQWLSTEKRVKETNFKKSPPKLKPNVQQKVIKRNNKKARPKGIVTKPSDFEFDRPLGTNLKSFDLYSLTMSDSNNFNRDEIVGVCTHSNGIVYAKVNNKIEKISESTSKVKKDVAIYSVSFPSLEKKSLLTKNVPTKLIAKLASIIPKTVLGLGKFNGYKIGSLISIEDSTIVSFSQSSVFYKGELVIVSRSSGGLIYGETVEESIFSFKQGDETESILCWVVAVSEDKSKIKKLPTLAIGKIITDKRINVASEKARIKNSNLTKIEDEKMKETQNIYAKQLRDDMLENRRKDVSLIQLSIDAQKQKDENERKLKQASQAKSKPMTPDRVFLREDKGRSIAIDGPNVSASAGGDHYCMKGLLNCVRYYERAGYEPMCFLSRHYVEEREMKVNPQSKFTYRVAHREDLNQLIKENKVCVIPSEDYDDSYAIDYIVKNDGCVVSNDHFRDNTLVAFQWLKERRISFTFIPNTKTFVPNPDFRFPPRGEQVQYRDKMLLTKK